MTLTPLEQQLKAFCEQFSSSKTEQEALEVARKIQWLLRERIEDIRQDGAVKEGASLSSDVR